MRAVATLLTLAALPGIPPVAAAGVEWQPWYRRRDYRAERRPGPCCAWPRDPVRRDPRNGFSQTPRGTGRKFGGHRGRWRNLTPKWWVLLRGMWFLSLGGLPANVATHVDWQPSPTVRAYQSIKMVAVPTMVQHAVWTQSDRGTAVTKSDFYFPNPTLSGNCLVVGCTASNANGFPTTAITDDQGNTYTPGPTNDGFNGTNGMRIMLFYALNATAGVRKVTATFTVNSPTYVFPVVSEFYNVATSAAADGTAGADGASSTTWATGNLSPATTVDGDLIYQYAIDESSTGAVPVVSQTANFTAGSGFTLLHTQRPNGSCAQFQVQATHGAINPTITAGTARVFNTVAMALKAHATGSGTAPGAGIRIVHVQHNYVWTSITTSPFNLQFPCSGNLLASSSVFGGSTLPQITSITDGNSNSWSQAGSGQTSPGGILGAQIFYAQAATTSNAMSVTVNFSNPTFNGGSNVVLYDVTGAATSGVLDTTFSASGTQTVAGNLTTISGAAPSTANGLVLFCEDQDSGEMNGFTTPGTYRFDSATSPETTSGTDFYDNLGGWGHVNNVDTSALTFTLTNSQPVGGVGNWCAFAAAFKAPSVGLGVGDAPFVSATLRRPPRPPAPIPEKVARPQPPGVIDSAFWSRTLRDPRPLARLLNWRLDDNYAHAGPPPVQADLPSAGVVRSIISTVQPRYDDTASMVGAIAGEAALLTRPMPVLPVWPGRTADNWTPVPPGFPGIDDGPLGQLVIGRRLLAMLLGEAVIPPLFSAVEDAVVKPLRILPRIWPLLFPDAWMGLGPVGIRGERAFDQVRPWQTRVLRAVLADDVLRVVPPTFIDSVYWTQPWLTRVARVPYPDDTLRPVPPAFLDAPYWSTWLGGLRVLGLRPQFDDVYMVIAAPYLDSLFPTATLRDVRVRTRMLNLQLDDNFARQVVVPVVAEALPLPRPMRPLALLRRIYDDTASAVIGAGIGDDVVPTQFAVFGPAWPAYIPDAWMGAPPVIGRGDARVPVVRSQPKIPLPFASESGMLGQIFAVGDSPVPIRLIVVPPRGPLSLADSSPGAPTPIVAMDSLYGLVPPWRIPLLVPRMPDDVLRVLQPILTPAEGPYVLAALRWWPAWAVAVGRWQWVPGQVLRQREMRYITTVAVAPFALDVNVQPFALTVLVLRA